MKLRPNYFIRNVQTVRKPGWILICFCPDGVVRLQEKLGKKKSYTVDFAGEALKEKLGKNPVRIWKHSSC